MKNQKNQFGRKKKQGEGYILYGPGCSASWEALGCILVHLFFDLS